MLMDVGCKYERYCSDITRVFPMSGYFTSDQKLLYNIVLKTLKSVIRFIVPGKKFSDIEIFALEQLYKNSRQIGLVYMNSSGKT